MYTYLILGALAGALVTLAVVVILLILFPRHNPDEDTHYARMETMQRHAEQRDFRMLEIMGRNADSSDRIAAAAEALLAARTRHKRIAVPGAQGGNEP